MITIPAGLTTAFTTQQGVDPQFIISIKWSDILTIEYGIEEFPDSSWTVYPYVESFSNYQSVAQVAGMGETSSIDVTFNDFYGHMKEMLDTYDFMDQAVLCIIYLTVHGAVDDTYKMQLFEGRIQDPVDWAEEGKKLTLSVASTESDGITGYIPSEDDIDATEPDLEYYKEYLSGQVWPEVFGTLKFYPLAKIADRKSCVTVQDRSYFITQDDLILPIDDLRTFDTDDAKASSEVFVNLVGEKQGKFSLIAEGRFHTKAQILIDFPSYTGTADFGFVITDATDAGNKVTDQWYTNLPFNFVDVDSVGEFDADGNTHNRKEITLLLGADYPAPPPSPTPKGWGGTVLSGSTDDAFIQFSKAKITWTDSVFGSLGAVVKVIDQKDNLCTIGLSVNVDNYVADSGNIDWIKKFDTQANVIPSGTKIFDMAATDQYVVDLKKDTVIQDLYLDTGDGMKALNQDIYVIENNTATTTAASGVWQENTGISTEIWVKSTDSTLPDEYTIASIDAEAYQRYLDGYEEDGVDIEIWARAKSTVDMDDDVILHLGQKNSNLNSSSTVSDTDPQSVNFVYLEQEDVAEIFPEIAWQSKKGIRRSFDGSGNPTYDLVDISTPTAPVLAFTDDNVLLDSIHFGFTPIEEVVTHIDATASGSDYSIEPVQGGRKKNKVKYGEKKFESDFYVHNTKATVSDALDFWIDRLAVPRRMIRFTGFLDAFGLEVWDRVSVSFSDPSFYDTTDGVPFTNVHAGSPTSWQSEGWVREVHPRIQEGQVDFVVELDQTMDDSPFDPGIRAVP